MTALFLLPHCLMVPKQHQLHLLSWLQHVAGPSHLPAHWGSAVHCCVCVQVDSLLERSSAPAAGEEPGPDTELEHWRQQMSRFNSLTEQLKTHECRLVLGVTSMTHSQVCSSRMFAASQDLAGSTATKAA